MKKGRFIILAAAVLALLAGCAKTEPAPGTRISFQVAKFRSVSKAVPYGNGYSDVPFGAYAWHNAPNPANDTIFMVNQKVTYDAENDLWAPSGVNYYWPHQGSLDFICYSPYDAQHGPEVGKNTIRYTGYDVYANPDVDLLYADKVNCLTENYTTSYNGVPIVFRHALARVSFNLRLAYYEKEGTADKTRWEVKLESFELTGLHSKGTLQLSQNGGVWEMPSGKVWTPDGSRVDLSFDCSSLSKFTDLTPQAIGSTFVLPQAIGDVKAMLKFTISTFRDTGGGYDTTPFIIERDVLLPTVLSSSALNSWAINHNVVYNIVLSPSRSSGAGSGTETQDPSIITFDPAVGEWQNISIETSIGL